MEMKSGFIASILLATVWSGAAFPQGAPIKLADVAIKTVERKVEPF